MSAIFIVKPASEFSANATEDHYSTFDHGTAHPAEINPTIEDSNYSVPVKYQNPQVSRVVLP